MGRRILESIETEYRRYRDLGRKGLEQVPEERISQQGPGGGNSLVVLVQHLSGNMRSRFTDFLDSDGEKPWRNRDEEFREQSRSKAELLQLWSEGWGVVEQAVKALNDSDLERIVRIRGQELTVIDALLRSVTHVGYHVGQMLYLAKILCGDSWDYLSIAPGGSSAYNQNPTREKP